MHLPIHYSPHNRFSAVCGLNILAEPQTMIGTTDPRETTCARCLKSPQMSGQYPITGTEMSDLMGRARGVLRDSRAAALAALGRDERRHRVLLALEDLHRDTPWWALRTRRMIARTVAELAAA